MATRSETVEAVGTILLALNDEAVFNPEFAREHASYHDSLETLAKLVVDQAEQIDVLKARLTLAEQAIDRQNGWRLWQVQVREEVARRRSAQIADMPSDFGTKPTPLEWSDPALQAVS